MSLPTESVLRDGALHVRDLHRYALAFDEISGPEKYSAVEFVTWLRGEVRYTFEHVTVGAAGRPGRVKVG